MAVVGVPGYIGSSAVSETGQRYMSTAAGQLRIAVPTYMSRFAGQSREQVIDIPANNNYTWATLVNQIKALGVAGNAFRVNINGPVISSTTGAPCLNFTSDLAGVDYILLVINSGAWVSGRGGNGGGPSSTHGGKPGGVGITNAIGTKLRIQNNGAIGGGGGGGGDVGLGGNRTTVAGGSGGRPWGLGGTENYGASGGRTDGNDATRDAPGARTASVNYGTNIGGAGGNLGAAGEGGIASGADSQTAYAGGAAGAAVNGNAPTWVTLGSIYGSRV